MTEAEDNAALAAMDLPALIAETAERWKASNEADLDVQIAKRSGDSLEQAIEGQRLATNAWYRAKCEATAKARETVQSVLGVDPTMLKGFL